VRSPSVGEAILSLQRNGPVSSGQNLWQSRRTPTGGFQGAVREGGGTNKIPREKKKELQLLFEQGGEGSENSSSGRGQQLCSLNARREEARRSLAKKKGGVRATRIRKDALPTILKVVETVK